MVSFVLCPIFPLFKIYLQESEALYKRIKLVQISELDFSACLKKRLHILVSKLVFRVIIRFDRDGYLYNDDLMIQSLDFTHTLFFFLFGLECIFTLELACFIFINHQILNNSDFRCASFRFRFVHN